MKKYILLAYFIALANFSYAQDADAPINSLWKKIASDSTLTYQQIVSTCDSMFAEAGYPVFPDTSNNNNDSTNSEDSTEHNEQMESEDGNPFYEYSL